MRTRLLLLLMISSFTVMAQTTTVGGRTISNDPVAKGIASYYHDKFEGRQTSTGEIFDNQKYTAASNTLALGTYVKVTNMSNGEYIYVRINDRMHKANTRLIDMASICAKELRFHRKGLAKVKVEIVPKSEGKKGILTQRTIKKKPANTDNNM